MSVRLGVRVSTVSCTMGVQQTQSQGRAAAAWAVVGTSAARPACAPGVARFLVIAEAPPHPVS